MERETMRSIAAWLLLASAHQEPVPSQVTAAGSCAQVTRPGTTPRGTPIGESAGSNKEEPMLLAAAIDRAKSRRVITILPTPLLRKKLVLSWWWWVALAGYGCGGLADDQGRLDGYAGGVLRCGVGDAVEQDAGRELAHMLERLADGGEAGYVEFPRD